MIVGMRDFHRCIARRRYCLRQTCCVDFEVVVGWRLRLGDALSTSSRAGRVFLWGSFNDHEPGSEETPEIT